MSERFARNPHEYRGKWRNDRQEPVMFFFVGETIGGTKRGYRGDQRGDHLHDVSVKSGVAFARSRFGS